MFLNYPVSVITMVFIPVDFSKDTRPKLIKLGFTISAQLPGKFLSEEASNKANCTFLSHF
jgi:hypothetical protein